MNIRQFLTEVGTAEARAFSQLYPIQRPDFLGDKFFPDSKTQNFKFTWTQRSGSDLATGPAPVHALDTEAEIAVRPALEQISAESLFIKEKIDQSEKLRRALRLIDNRSDEVLIESIFNDWATLAANVKLRTELMKTELLAKGTLTIRENNLDQQIDFGVPEASLGVAKNWSAADANIIKDIKDMVKLGRANGLVPNTAIVGADTYEAILANESIVQLVAYQGNALNIYNDQVKLDAIELATGVRLVKCDQTYRVPTKTGFEVRDMIDPATFSLFYAENGKVGDGIWGVTPEEEEYGPWDSKSANQFITLTMWSEPDPVITWSKASGMFLPTLPYALGSVIGKITL